MFLTYPLIGFFLKMFLERFENWEDTVNQLFRWCCKVLNAKKRL